MSFFCTNTGSFVWLYIAVVIRFPSSSSVFSNDVSTTGSLVYDPSSFLRYSSSSIVWSLLTAMMNFLSAKSNSFIITFSKSSSSSCPSMYSPVSSSLYVGLSSPSGSSNPPSGVESLSSVSSPFWSASSVICAKFVIFQSDLAVSFTLHAICTSL